MPKSSVTKSKGKVEDTKELEAKTATKKDKFVIPIHNHTNSTKRQCFSEKDGVVIKILVTHLEPQLKDDH